MSFDVSIISKGIWSIEQNDARCFLIDGINYALLVDCLYEGDLLNLCMNLVNKDVRLVLTHADKDHIGCISQFDQVFIHPSELYNSSLSNGCPLNIKPVWESDIFSLGTYSFEVILIPGHTSGSIALLERQNRFIIGGDSVQRGPIYMFGSNRNLCAYKFSILKLISLSTHFDFIYASHNDLIVPKYVLNDLLSLVDKVLNSELSGVEISHLKFPENTDLYSIGSARLLLSSV